MANIDDRLAPIFKWGGGKRQLLDEIIPLIPDYSRYYEPFVGGAAVLLALKPKYAVINDYNAELINTYKVIRDYPYELIELLGQHQRNNSIDYFYEVRDWDRKQTYKSLDEVSKAARSIYLNRTCFNGLYRVNKSGYFNTPCGKYKNPQILNKDRIMAMHKYLSTNKIDIRCGDYKESLKYIREGAFVYFDPPYMPPETGEETFTQYTVDGFNKAKQIELKEICDGLSERGIKFMLSNSYCSDILELYKDYNIKKVQARRTVSANANKRGIIDEVLVTNYDV